MIELNVFILKFIILFVCRCCCFCWSFAFADCYLLLLALFLIVCFCGSFAFAFDFAAHSLLLSLLFFLAICFFFSWSFAFVLGELIWGIIGKGPRRRLKARRMMWIGLMGRRMASSWRCRVFLYCLFLSCESRDQCILSNVLINCWIKSLCLWWMLAPFVSYDFVARWQTLVHFKVTIGRRMVLIPADRILHCWGYWWGRSIDSLRRLAFIDSFNWCRHLGCIGDGRGIGFDVWWN